MKSASTGSVVVGVDVGGTFTDFVFHNEETGDVVLLKRPTTLDDQSGAVMEGVDSLGFPERSIKRLTHGTTTATNAVIERTGARCALVTTRGFRDVLELGRRERQRLYGLSSDFVPLIPRSHRLEVGGRVGADGLEHCGIQEDDMSRLVAEIEALDVDAVAIALLHSYANDRHEKAIEDTIREEHPGLFVVRSSSLYPERGEFARTVTAAVAAYVGPLVGRYFEKISTALVRRGHGGAFQVIQSNGGSMVHTASLRFPHTTIKSGPAAGVTAAGAIAAANGIDDAVSFDMGGTSADFAFILGGSVRRVVENSLGFRLPLHVPMLDINTVGAGGGSIATLDARAMLRVGPQSAGAEPGPAGFGRGGAMPTVTDAHIHLGHVPLTSLQRNGVVAPSRELAATAIDVKIGQPLGLPVGRASEAILEVVNENMAGALRLMSIDRGIDLRRLHLVAFGGAGPLHACSLVRKLDMKGALIPPYPGLTSASGCLVTPLRHETTRAVGRPLDALEPGRMRSMADDQRREGEEHLSRQGVAAAETRQELTLVMQYEGQRHAVDVTIPPSDVDPETARAAFVDRYTDLYSTPLERAIVFVAMRSAVVAPRPDFHMPAPAGATGTGSGDRIDHVQSFYEGKPATYEVRPRSRLEPGAAVVGPVVLTQQDSTVLVEPGFRAAVTPAGALLLEQVR